MQACTNIRVQLFDAKLELDDFLATTNYLKHDNTCVRIHDVDDDDVEAGAFPSHRNVSRNSHRDERSGSRRSRHSIAFDL